MFAAVVTNKSGKYRVFDRDCELYANAPMGAFGRISVEAGGAWENYIALLGGGPILCTEEALAAMKRVVHLCEANRRELEIVLYTPVMGEAPGPGAAFLGFDVAGSQFASLLSGGACCALPESFSKMLNGCGLLGFARSDRRTGRIRQRSERRGGRTGFPLCSHLRFPLRRAARLMKKGSIIHGGDNEKTLEEAARGLRHRLRRRL